MTTAIGYAFRLRIGETQRTVLCPECCGGERPMTATEVHDTDRDRKRFGVEGDVIVCHKCGERLDGAQNVALTVHAKEIPILVFALEHALTSISEAHPEDRARLKALLERLEKTR